LRNLHDGCFMVRAQGRYCGGWEFPEPAGRPWPATVRRQALDLPPEPLPTPRAGTPKRRRTDGLV